MLRVLRLPCALLALLLSAFGGGRLAAVERHDDDAGKTPIVSPAPAAAALPDAPTPVTGPAPGGLAPCAEPTVALIAGPVAWIAGPSLPAPCQRRGSAGGARAP